MTAAPKQFDVFAPDTPKEIVRLAAELALKAGPSGITVDNVRVAAVQRGLMDDVGYEREYAFLGSTCKLAGLIATDRRVRSQLPKSHGNLRVIWVHPQYRQGSA